jgi:2-dehydropantoate 2-reductase
MFQGPRGKIEPLVECLNRGGMPAKYSAKMREQMIVPSTILEVVVAGLEASHWSLEQLEEPQALALTCKAMKQALPIATKMGGVQGPHPLMRGALRPFAIRALLKQVSWMAPFDFEAYMKLHFTKVGRQMHEGIDRMIDEGSRAGFSVDALETLKSRRVETS